LRVFGVAGYGWAAVSERTSEKSELTTYWSELTFIIVMIRRTGLTPWEFECTFPGSLASVFLGSEVMSRFQDQGQGSGYLGLMVRSRGERGLWFRVRPGDEGSTRWSTKSQLAST
jgi:hypothetical protein